MVITMVCFCYTCISKYKCISNLIALKMETGCAWYQGEDHA